MSDYKIEARSDFLPFWSKGDIGSLSVLYLRGITGDNLRKHLEEGDEPNYTESVKSLIIHINGGIYTDQLLRKYFGDIEVDEIFRVI